MKSSSTPIPTASAGLIQRLAHHWKAEPSSRTGTGLIARLFQGVQLAAPKPKPAPASVAMEQLERQFAALKTEEARQAFVASIADQVRAASKPKQQHPIRRAQFAVMPAKAQATFIREGGRVI